MYERDLKKLTRQELLELLLEQSRRIDRLNIKIADLEEQLSKQNTAFKESGNLAEAALKVSGFFEAAQKAADYYIEQSKRSAQEESGEYQNELFNTYKEQAEGFTVNAEQEFKEEEKPLNISETVDAMPSFDFEEDIDSVISKIAGKFFRKDK